MTTEQREAIEYLEDMANNQKDLNKSGYVCASEKIDTVLSLIKEQEEEIEKYEKIYKEYDCYRWVKELNKKDKQIDLMADEIIMTKPINCAKTNEFSTKKIYMSKEEIKQYFERKVEDGN